MPNEIEVEQCSGEMEKIIALTTDLNFGYSGWHAGIAKKKRKRNYEMVIEKMWDYIYKTHAAGRGWSCGVNNSKTLFDQH